MDTQTRNLYRSFNGDNWLLARNESARVYVLHRAYISSSGRESRASAGDFLVRGGRPRKSRPFRSIDVCSHR